MRYEILKTTFNILLINILIFSFGSIVKSETEFEFYINDFLTKNGMALQMLKDIEIKLKSGLKENSCSRQREAAKIGILANESLLKAYKVNGSVPPMEIMESNKKRWVSILDNCHD